jgi:hypothetical protein
VQDPATGRFTSNGGPQRKGVGSRYERPSDHGINFHALRSFYPSLLGDEWGIPVTILKKIVGHANAASLDPPGAGGRRGGYDVTSDGYMKNLTDRMDVWYRRARAIITVEFGPYLPGLLAAGDLQAARSELARWHRPPREDGRQLRALPGA